MSDRASDNAIVSKLKFLSPLSVVADLRIRLFVRIIVCAPSQLLLILSNAYKNNKSWVRASIDDLEPLAHVTEKCSA